LADQLLQPSDIGVHQRHYWHEQDREVHHPDAKAAGERLDHGQRFQKISVASGSPRRNGLRMMIAPATSGITPTASRRSAPITPGTPPRSAASAGNASTTYTHAL